MAVVAACLIFFCPRRSLVLPLGAQQYQVISAQCAPNGNFVLHGLSLTIHNGEHTAILGANGAGKSILVRLLTHEERALPLDNGSPVRVFGDDNWNVFELRAREIDSAEFSQLTLDETRKLSSGMDVGVRQLVDNVQTGTIAATDRAHSMIQFSTLMMVGLYLMAQTTTATSQMSITIDIVLVGLGLGVTMPLYINAVQSALPMRYLGVGTSQFQFWRNVGGTVGAAVLGTILAQRLPEAISTQIASVNLPPAFKNLMGSSASNPGPAPGPTSYTITVTGTSGSLTNSTNLTLIVNP